MMNERRYSEQEVSVILERAARAPGTLTREAASVEGMTLSQLQEIGREVGIAPDAMAAAARGLDLEDRQYDRRWLGLPIGVGLTANLGRTLSADEWQRLVVDLRDTFEAQGRVGEQGAFRQWTNGNLQVHIEPTPDGSQIRMRTLKEDARVLLSVGLMIMALGAVAFLSKVALGSDPARLAARFLPMALIGLGAAAFGGFRVPAWARERRSQMERIVARLRAGDGASPP